jgi:hypothetical protein
MLRTAALTHESVSSFKERAINNVLTQNIFPTPPNRDSSRIGFLEHGVYATEQVYFKTIRRVDANCSESMTTSFVHEYLLRYTNKIISQRIIYNIDKKKKNRNLKFFFFKRTRSYCFKK